MLRGKPRHAGHYGAADAVSGYAGDGNEDLPALRPCLYGYSAKKSVSALRDIRLWLSARRYDHPEVRRRSARPGPYPRRHDLCTGKRAAARAFVSGGQYAGFRIPAISQRADPAAPDAGQTRGGRTEIAADGRRQRDRIRRRAAVSSTYFHAGGRDCGKGGSDAHGTHGKNRCDAPTGAGQAKTRLALNKAAEPRR